MSTSHAPGPAHPPLVIIPCSARKARRPAPAGDIYIGPYHRSRRRTAHALTTPDRILILSALHGFLSLDQFISPYGLRTGATGSVSPSRLREQAGQLGVDQEPPVIVLGGRDYVAAARSVWPDAITPLAGAGGMGRQRGVLAQVATTGLLPQLRSAT